MTTRVGSTGSGGALPRRALFFLFVGVLAYLTWIALRTVRMYRAAKTGPGMSSNLYGYDPILGHALVPGARGAQFLSVGPDVPIRVDDRGFRAPVDDRPESHRPLVLSLGCSFTFGVACRAEDAYPYLVGQMLGGSSINAGVPSYGLQQMLIRARDLVPRYRPDYVIVQLSPWLVQRAQTPFAPTYSGKLACPFFTSKNGRVEISPPPFRTLMFDLPASAYRKTRSGLTDFLSFGAKVGVPLFLHDDLCMGEYWVRRAVGRVPSPAADGLQVVDTVFDEISEICRRNQAELLTLVLTVEPLYGPAVLPSRRDLTLVKVDDAIFEGAPDQSRESYLKFCGQWRGNPPVLVDPHPNERTHRIMAGCIVRAIRSARPASSAGANF